MVSVYMNPERLEIRIADLEKFAQSVIEARGSVSSMYNEAKEPIQSGESMASLQSAVDKAAQAIETHAKELRKCKTTMVNLNSNGIASHDLEGGINIEVPDDSAGLETADKFEKWSQGATDANDLRSGKDKLPSGRSFDEVMESMRANKGDTTYSNSFIDRVGPENLTKIGHHDVRINKEAPVLGEVLATASTTWNEEKSKRNADLIVGSVDEESEWSRIPVLNHMIGHHDSDGDHINDLKFGTNFLVFMGRGLEELPLQKIKSTLTEHPDRQNPDPEKFLDSSRNDPLSGVLDAMVSNEEAARVFLAPHGGLDDDVQRVKELINRNPVGDNAWTDTWAGLSSRTAEAHGTDPYDDSTKSPESHQAAAITAGVVNTIGEKIQSKETSSVSGTARSRLSFALSKFPYAIDNTVQNGKTSSVNSKGEPVPLYPDVPKQVERWSQGMGWQPPFTVKGLSGAIQVISEDSNDLKRAAEPLGDMHRAKMVDAVANKEDVARLRQTISTISDANGFILGASHARVENDAARKDANTKALIDTVFSASSFIPGVGKNVDELVEKIVNYGKDRSVDALKAATEDAFTGNLEVAEKVDGLQFSEAGKVNVENTIIQLMGLGVIDDKTIATGQIRDKHGNLLSFRDKDGNLDLSKLKVEGSAERDYLIERFVSNPNNVDSEVHLGLDQMGQKFDQAYQKGRSGVG